MQALLDVSTGDAELDDADAERLMDAVADDRRRRALRVLAEDDPEQPLSTLAERVHSLETEEHDELARQDVKISLHHSELPKLDELELVTYDPDDKEVELDVDPDSFQFDGALVE